ncbi:hypothetical protein GDO86_016707 [Hymenochirus boettgeri]|uniref:Uncharacterized protein n=1 Tax=Hymenochirus boettgeri TaxID=247094 RepID=A0A8T2IKJ9_9PIPI|nr:hypothetical protein GDO86_016707 [Hymenochirus boettgeri]
MEFSGQCGCLSRSLITLISPHHRSGLTMVHGPHRCIFNLIRLLAHLRISVHMDPTIKKRDQNTHNAYEKEPISLKHVVMTTVLKLYKFKKLLHV